MKNKKEAGKSFLQAHLKIIRKDKGLEKQASIC
jgi:hypothetical protein